MINILYIIHIFGYEIMVMVQYINTDEKEQVFNFE